eukprot:IDg12536t1
MHVYKNWTAAHQDALNAFVEVRAFAVATEIQLPAEAVHGGYFAALAHCLLGTRPPELAGDAVARAAASAVLRDAAVEAAAVFLVAQARQTRTGAFPAHHLGPCAPHRWERSTSL